MEMASRAQPLDSCGGNTTLHIFGPKSCTVFVRQTPSTSMGHDGTHGIGLTPMSSKKLAERSGFFRTSRLYITSTEAPGGPGWLSIPDPYDPTE